MKTSNRNDPGKAARQTQPKNEIRSRGGQKLTDKSNNPGGGGSQDRVAGKGNDISHEDDLLQGDIEDEVDNALSEGMAENEGLAEDEKQAKDQAANTSKMREVERKREGEP